MTERMNMLRIQEVESAPFAVRFDAMTDITQNEWKRVREHMQKYAFEKPSEGISPKFYNRQKIKSFSALKTVAPSQFAQCVGDTRLFTHDQVDDAYSLSFDKRDFAENAAAVKMLQGENVHLSASLDLEELMQAMHKLRKSKQGNDSALAVMFAGNIKTLFPGSQPMDDEFVAEAKELIQRLLKRQDDDRVQASSALSALAFAAQIRLCRPDKAEEFTRDQWRMITAGLHLSLRDDIGRLDPEYILYASIVGAEDVRVTDHGIEITAPQDPEIEPVPESLQINL